MAKIAGPSIEQMLPYLDKPEVDTDELDNSALETERLEEPNQGRLGNTDLCSCS